MTIFMAIIQVIVGNQMIEDQAIETVVGWIENANKTVIYGIGSSGFTAAELAQRLIRMGLNATGVTDSHLMIINSSIIKEGELVIAISNSGETPELIASLEIAKKKKAKIIALTSFQKQFADETGGCHVLRLSLAFRQQHGVRQHAVRDDVPDRCDFDLPVAGP